MNVPKPDTTNGSSSTQQDKDIFASQDGLLHLLVAIRGSSMPDESKMTARDAVLEYSQQDNPDSREKIKQDILTVLSPYQNEFPGLLLKPVNQQTSSVSDDAELNQSDVTAKTEKPQSGFRGARPAPVFKAPVKKQPATSNPETTKEKQSSQPTSTPEPKIKEIPPEPKVKTESDKTTPALQTKPEPQSAPEPEVSVEAEPIVQSSTIEGHQERIKAIKRSVNEKVGNPINLIETNSEVGREYMNSLLDAMKKISGDGAGADAAMRRLEAAYKSVQELLNNGDVSKIQTESKPEKVADKPVIDKQTAVPQKNSPKPEPVAKEPQPVPQVQPVPTPEVEEPSVITEPEPEQTLSNQEEDEFEHRSMADREEVGKIPLRKIKLPASKPPVTKPTNEQVKPAESLEQKKNEPAVQSNETSPSSNRLHSLADVPNPLQAKPETKTEHKTQTKKESGGFWSHLTNGNKEDNTTDKKNKSTESSAPLRNTPAPPVDDRLFNPEVTAGLEQLLSEWKLFKSSGLFGTGPKGKNHPLYKNLAQLPMAAVIAGRFEGASPEIKQSITDYMNGWRYEQGIVHELNENFEHYLRRVIAHILERAPKKEVHQQTKEE